MLDSLDAAAARRWAVATRAAFAARRAEIDALNVFPVPDGDTGTNLYLTFDAALEAVRADHERRGVLGTASLEQECTGLSQAMLLTARGNSGVIFSQLARGFAEVVGEGQHAAKADAARVAAGLVRGAARARESVGRPVEGTILSVADAASAAAQARCEKGGGLSEVTAAAVEAAREALHRTTSQLPALQRAGVVDAGAAGYLLLVEALDRVVSEDRQTDGFAVDGVMPDLGRRQDWAPATRSVEHPAREGAGLVTDTSYAGGPAYEVMFLLDGSSKEKVHSLRGRLDGLGDSLLVVGGPELWNVHVHVDDVGAALECAVAAGRPHRIRVTHFGDQPGTARPASGLAVVACAAGPGIAAILEEAGATTVPSGPGRRASAGTLLEAARASHALSVIMLPNDKDTLLAAQAAASAVEQEGIELHVVPSRTAVSGLAALAVYDPEVSASRNTVAMSSAAAATRHGAVMIASREALASGGWCHAGDVLGVVNGDIVVVGSDLLEVAREVVFRLLSSGGELLTVLTGAGAPDDLADRLRSSLRPDRRDVEVVTYAGGQPVYPLLLGVE